MTSKARELSVLILKMLVESLGLPEQYKLDVEDLNNYNDTRVTRYQLPPDTKETEIALTLHTDKGTLALICENDVQGLQVLSKTGNYVDVKIPSDGFVVIVGDILKVIYTYIYDYNTIFCCCNFSISFFFIRINLYIKLFHFSLNQITDKFKIPPNFLNIGMEQWTISGSST